VLRVQGRAGDRQMRGGVGSPPVRPGNPALGWGSVSWGDFGAPTAPGAAARGVAQWAVQTGSAGAGSSTNCRSLT
jgi:hypothetical protein